MTAVIQTSGLTKAYGHALALDSVDLAVEEGSIFGFLGPNGAGKTTFLRILTGLSHPTAGSVRLLGRDIATAGPSLRRELGFLPDVPAFYDWMTARETLRFAGNLCGLTGPALAGRVDMLLEFAGLSGVDRQIGGYSRGMRQRLGLAQALINAPALLLLDEPTSALDPGGRRDLLDFIASLRGRTTVFFSTHILGDVERVCDAVAILDKGRIVTQAPMQELRTRHGQQRISVEVNSLADEVAGNISTRKWAVSVARGPRGEIEARVSDVDAAQHEIPAIISSLGAGLVRLETAELDLEEVFFELIGAG